MEGEEADSSATRESSSESPGLAADGGCKGVSPTGMAPGPVPWPESTWIGRGCACGRGADPDGGLSEGLLMNCWSLERAATGGWEPASTVTSAWACSRSRGEIGLWEGGAVPSSAEGGGDSGSDCAGAWRIGGTPKLMGGSGGSRSGEGMGASKPGESLTIPCLGSGASRPTETTSVLGKSGLSWGERPAESISARVGC